MPIKSLPEVVSYTNLKQLLFVPKISNPSLYKRPEPPIHIFCQNQLSLYLLRSINAYMLPELLLPTIVGLSCSVKSINAYKMKV